MTCEVVHINMSESRDKKWYVWCLVHHVGVEADDGETIDDLHESVAGDDDSNAQDGLASALLQVGIQNDTDDDRDCYALDHA